MSLPIAEPRQDRSFELERILKLGARREPAVAQVVTWVGLGIIEGRLAPGEDLNSVDLARRFSSSRTPVREALMLLEQEGLVELRARRRPRVALFPPTRIQEIYFVREHLLSIIGRLVVERATDDDIDDLTARVAGLRGFAARGDIESYFWAHVALQERMAEIAGYATLKGILDSLALRTLILRHASLAQPGRLSASVADQVRILEAIQARDSNLTALLLARATVAALRAIERSDWGRWPSPVEDDA